VLYTIQADSLAIDSPGEILTESRAFGKAFSTAKRDSVTPPAETDWITGDTLTIRFAQEKDSGATRPRSRLRQLVSRGTPAKALTHHPNDRDTTNSGPAINYSRGTMITLTMVRDRVDQVVVAGKADGVHLVPRPPVAPDSAKADSAKAPRPVTPKSTSSPPFLRPRTPRAGGGCSRAWPVRRATRPDRPSPTARSSEARAHAKGGGATGRRQPVGGRRALLPGDRSCRTAC
jgi:hypothetical protein